MALTPTIGSCPCLGSNFIAQAIAPGNRNPNLSIRGCNNLGDILMGKTRAKQD
jgi:hypothetical protein